MNFRMIAIEIIDGDEVSRIEVAEHDVTPERLGVLLDVCAMLGPAPRAKPAHKILAKRKSVVKSAR